MADSAEGVDLPFRDQVHGPSDYTGRRETGSFQVLQLENRTPDMEIGLYRISGLF